MQAAASLPMRDILVDVDRADLEIYADPLFEKVFYNLIDNALNYGGGAMTAIRITSRETGAGLVIACEDDGVGIPDEDKKHLFERGHGKNTGLGLFLSREILSITGITLAETGLTGKGARFEMVVPKDNYRAIPGTRE
ncbi:MAG: ATP-binding protein, partial [Methanoregula sp.]